MNTMNDQRSEPDEVVTQTALDWLVRRAGGGFTAQDEAHFQTWLRADDAHRQAHARQQAEWTALDRLPADGLAMLRANLAEDLAMEAHRTTTPARRRFWVPAMSAAALATVMLGTGVLAWRHWQAQPVFEQSFATRRGQQLEMPLPDGSRLHLDTMTSVKVTFYRQRREVVLPEGQAMFSVQADKARPFQVSAGPLRITVVGTQFSVRHTPSLPGDEGVKVAVREGRVRVDGVAVPPVSLVAGQQVSANVQGQLSEVSPLPSTGIAPWREQLLSFDNTRLDRVLAELARYGDTHLVVRDPKVASLRVTGSFNPTRLDSFAKVLPHAAPVRLQATGTGVSEVVLAKP